MVSRYHGNDVKAASFGETPSDRILLLLSEQFHNNLYFPASCLESYLGNGICMVLNNLNLFSAFLQSIQFLRSCRLFMNTRLIN